MNSGVCYEIIQIYSKSLGFTLKQLDFDCEKFDKVSVIHFGTIDNSFRRRFMCVNFPINIKLNINKIKKMKEKSNYIINLLPNDIIIHENNISKQDKKKELNDINKMKTICDEIEKIIIFEEEVDLNKKQKIQNDLTQYDDYFNQNLMNKGDYIWNSEEFSFYYHYFKFKLFLIYLYYDDNKKVEYYLSAIKIFANTYKELKEFTDVSFYEKICVITSLYVKLKTDFEHKENKNHSIGEYRLLNINNNKIECYNLAYNFILNIINNLKENSLIFLPLLQINSGFSKNINSDNENEIFEISMVNVDMVKRHLKSLLPKIIFIVRHPLIKSKRGSMDKPIGTIYLYESSIFRNKLGKTIDSIINCYPKDAAVIISFIILHEIFIHKKLRSHNDFIFVRETPSKFVGTKFDVKNFYFSDKKHDLDPLSIYNKDKFNSYETPKEGESGRMIEYFFENEKFEIINYLKKYLGFGDLLDRVDLIVDENFDRLHSYIKAKIDDGKAQLLYEDKTRKINIKKNNSDENDEDKNIINIDEEDEEEEEDDDEELSEETKRFIKSEIE